MKTLGRNSHPPNFTLRLAEQKDAIQLDSLFFGLAGPSDRGRIGEIRKTIKDKEIVVAASSRRGRRIVGFVHGIVHHDPISAGPLLYITSLYVKPDFQHRGIGTSLLDFIIDTSVRYYSIRGVEVATARKSALKFYRRLGFSPFKADFEEKLLQLDAEKWREQRHWRAFVE